MLNRENCFNAIYSGNLNIPIKSSPKTKIVAIIIINCIILLKPIILKSFDEILSLSFTLLLEVTKIIQKATIPKSTYINIECINFGILVFRTGSKFIKSNLGYNPIKSIETKMTLIIANI